MTQPYLLINNDIIIRNLPLAEWGAVNLNDGILDERFGTEKFVVTCIVHHINDSGFSRDGL